MAGRPMPAYANAVAAYGLPGAGALPAEPLSADAFPSLVAECEQHRILGLLGAAVRDGAFPVTDDQRDDLEHHWSGWLAHAVRVERLLLRITDVLTAAGIRSIVLKGVALAHTVYHDPAMRVFGDVDLLVEPEHFGAAANVLVKELGGVRGLPEIRPGFDDRFGKEILVRVEDREVDLHRIFVEGPYGLTIRVEDLWAEPEPFAVGGRELLALSPVHRALHAAYAAALGDWPLRLVPARDLVQVMVATGVTLERMLDEARRWRAEAVVTQACRRVADALGADVFGGAGAPPATFSRRDAAYLAGYRGGGRGYRRQLLGATAVGGVGPALRYLAAIGWPSREYLQARGFRRTGFLRGAVDRMRT